MVTGFSEIDLVGCKGILLDLDDTLYLYEPCHNKALKSCWEATKDRLSYGEFSKLYRQLRNQVKSELYPQASCRSRLLAFQKMAEMFNLDKPYGWALKMHNMYWDCFIEAMEVHSEAVRFLNRCKDERLPVCLVSDMLTEIQIRKVYKLGIEQFINRMVTSEEAGAEKPDRRIFELALKKLGLGSSEVIMIGDDLEKDVKGAGEFGIKAYKIDLQ